MVAGTLVSLGAVTNLLKKPLEDLYHIAQGKVRDKVKEWKTTKGLKRISRKMSSIELVKTIWQVDKEVNLREFYYPARIMIVATPSQIDQIDRLPGGNIVFQGIPGQGKSIYLRYLCSRELIHGEKLPVFVELRRLQNGQSLRSLLITALERYGFEGADEDSLDFLLSSGKLILMLDGFDEISEDNSQKIIFEIEDLIEKHEDRLRVLVTSRPESGIERSARFRVFRLAPIEPSDIPHMVKRLCPDQVTSDAILAVVNSKQVDIKRFLVTPLMVTLLVLVYKTEREEPKELADFYDLVFWTLLSRHDRTKPGYVRKRKSGLADRQIKQVFEAFCFLSKRKNQSTFPVELANGIVEEAARATHIKVNTTDYLDDITRITGLLLEEGLQYHFVHLSIQEFFAASYVRQRPDVAAVAFYEAMQKPDVSRRWAEVLMFLREIDKYRFAKHYWLPQFDDWERKTGLNKTPDEVLDQTVDYFALGHELAIQGPNGVVAIIEEDTDRGYFGALVSDLLFRNCIVPVIVFAQNSKTLPLPGEGVPEIRIRLTKLLEDGSLMAGWRTHVTQFVQGIRAEAQSFRQLIDDEEQAKLILAAQ